MSCDCGQDMVHSFRRREILATRSEAASRPLGSIGGGSYWDSNVSGRKLSNLGVNCSAKLYPREFLTAGQWVQVDGAGRPRRNRANRRNQRNSAVCPSRAAAIPGGSSVETLSVSRPLPTVHTVTRVRIGSDHRKFTLGCRRERECRQLDKVGAAVGESWAHIGLSVTS